MKKDFFFNTFRNTLFLSCLFFIFYFCMRSFIISPPITEEYEYGSTFFEELNIAGTQIDTSYSSKYIVIANNSLNGDIYYKLKDGWTLSELKIYTRDKQNNLDMFYGALEKSEDLTELSDVTFGEYETYLYFFIENISQNIKAKLYVLVERFDELNIDFNSLSLNESYISIETYDKTYNLYYSNDKSDSLTQFISADEFVSDFCNYTSAGLKSEVYITENNIYTSKYSLSDNILKLKISKVSEVIDIFAIINDTKKINCLIKN